MTLKTHTDDLNTKTKTGLNHPRAISNTTFGQSKENISLVFKRFFRPILTHTNSAWPPDAADSHLQKLYKLSRTSYLKLQPIAHKHYPSLTCTKTKIVVLPLMQHMFMRGTHIYTWRPSPNHPLHLLRNAQTELDSMPTILENTLLLTHIHCVSPNARNTWYLPQKRHSSTSSLTINTQAKFYRACEDQVHLSHFRCGLNTAISIYMLRIG